MTSRHEREKEIFLAAREQPPERRLLYLAEATDGDPDLRRVVEELLRYDSEGAPLTTLIDPHRYADASPTLEVGQLDASREERGAGSLPPALLQAAVRRLRTVAILLSIAVIAMWLGPVTIAGRLIEELQAFAQWAPPTVTVIASLGVIWLSYSARDPRRILDGGLVYQVIVSYGLAFGQYWDTFAFIPADQIDFDVVGFSSVAMWMLLYSVLVPTRPLRALPALLLSATAPMVAFQVAVRYGQAPALEASRLFYTTVFPHLAAVAFAYIAMRMVYRLGRQAGVARELGSYRLERLLGEGGMGQVWAASHRLLARPAAIKVIRRETLGRDASSISSTIERFQHEARITAHLRSTHTVELYDFGVAHDGSLYYVMELLDGIDMDELVGRHGPLDPARVVWLMRQACLSLAEAHDRGLVHRDIKPANLFVCRQGIECDVLKVLDFGLARATTTPPGEDASIRIEGTPAFMAPELAEGASGEVDARADLYGLGCVMYWALTGQVVFAERTLQGLLLAHASLEPDPPSRRNVQTPDWIDEVVLRLLAKKPGDRYQSALELDSALTSLPADPPWSAARASRWWAENT